MNLDRHHWAVRLYGWFREKMNFVYRTNEHNETAKFDESLREPTDVCQLMSVLLLRGPAAILLGVLPYLVAIIGSIILVSSRPPIALLFGGIQMALFIMLVVGVCAGLAWILFKLIGKPGDDSGIVRNWISSIKSRTCIMINLTDDKK